MINLRNDYCFVGHKKVINKLFECANNTYDGYGLDEITKNAENIILKEINNKKAKVYFLSGGTITNKVFISHVLKPYEAVISAESGHINVHETGTIEQSGHKIITIKDTNGKIKASDITNILKSYTDFHMVKPKMVYITNATELGDIYSLNEIKEISKVCKQNDLYLYIDGARLIVALTSKENDLTLSDIAKYADAFYIGGTKCGAILGEALVVVNKDLQEEMRYAIKHFGGMYCKGFVIGMMFETLFTNRLIYEICEKENEYARYLYENLSKLNIKFKYGHVTNQLFLILSNEMVKKLQKEISFEIWEQYENNSVIRLCTHFALKQEEVEKTVEIFKNIKGEDSE